MRAPLDRIACTRRSGHHVQWAIESISGSRLAHRMGGRNRSCRVAPRLSGGGLQTIARSVVGSPPIHARDCPALEGPQDHLKIVRDKLRRRRDLTVEWAARTPRVSLVTPRGAFYAFPKLDIPEDDIAFVTELLTQKHVLCVHGAGFGQRPGTHHMRIVFLPQEETLVRGLRKHYRFHLATLLRLSSHPPCAGESSLSPVTSNAYSPHSDSPFAVRNGTQNSYK